MTTIRLPVSRTIWLGVIALLTWPGSLLAQVKYPPRPETVQVELRYRIRADREERIRLYRALQDHLKQIGFERKRQQDDDLDVFDPTAERMEGTIPSKNVFRLLEEPRIKSILFRPVDFKAPDDVARPVSLRIRIATGFLPIEQQRLHGQVVALLERLGFREAISYSHDNYTLIRGDLPYGNLFRLLKDLREEPAGWFAADSPRSELPLPVREVFPLRSVEVLPDPELTSLAPSAVPVNQLKYTPDLRAILAGPKAAESPLRVEVVYDRRFDPADLDALRERLRSSAARLVLNPATGGQELAVATLEGVIGTVVTIQFTRAADLDAFAASPEVVFARLPRASVETIAPQPAGAPAPPTAAEVMAATHLGAFHRVGYRGQGTRVVVIATSFPNLRSWLGIRLLGTTAPIPVTYIDLTAELSPDLLPAPDRPGGAGTAAALAAHAAAPQARIVLVRVDPTSFFQLQTVARTVSGSTGYTDAMVTRITQLSTRSGNLRYLTLNAQEEYRAAFQDRNDDDRAEARRVRARAALDLLTVEQGKLTAAIERATALQQATLALTGCDVVVNTLVWETGYSLDGLSDVSQLLDTNFASEALARPQSRSATRPTVRPRPVWVQAASPSAGSVWGGPYLDRDGNGAMEFAPASTPIRPDEWTHELNFLSVRAADGAVTPALPAGATVRLTVQWRERHDPTGYGGLNAIFPLTIRVFRQLDPEGKVQASDELREVARPVGGPYPLYAEPLFGVYEQIVEFTVAEAGRYCVRLDAGQLFDVRLPALRREIQIQPRLYAEFVGAGPGRLVFSSYAPLNVGVGMPGDARAAVAVGELSTLKGPPAPGLTGGGTGVELLLKPDLYTIGVAGPLAGSGVSAGLAGGALAALIGSGAPPAELLRATGMTRGGPVVIPDNWIRVVPRRP